MIEVLVSALVLVVGVLGVAALQVTALKNLQSSGHYGVASMMANDITDRMWVNQAQALANAYVHDGLPSPAPKNCVTSTCTDAEMAAWDVFDWQQQLQGYTAAGDIEVPPMLPAGQGSVAQIGATTSYLVTIRWDDDRSGSTDTNCPPLSDADLDCYTITITF